MAVEGFCQPPFQEVCAEFERNFAERGEIGAAVCVILDGDTVVDLWGGTTDRHRQRPWERDTIGLVWSATKGAVALCAHILASRGRLDLDLPVCQYWPEFAQGGKEDILVRWLLNHQAGLPAIRAPLSSGGLYDWNYMVGRLAAEEPFWTPGTRQGYAASTFGHLVGEVIRRVTGKDVGTFFREEVAGPLGLDFHIGLPREHETRVAPTIRPDTNPPGEPVSAFVREARGDRRSIQALVVNNSGRRTGPRDYDSPEAHQAVLPSQGGITNARGLAGMYNPLARGGKRHRTEFVDADSLAAMAAVSSASTIDATLLTGLRFSLGFMKSSDNRRRQPGLQESVLLSETAFGHAGMGGSLGFADPAVGLAFGYSMNKQGRGVLLNERGQSLVDAVYRALGFRSNDSGRWV